MTKQAKPTNDDKRINAKVSEIKAMQSGLYIPVMWAGVREVFKCQTCLHCADTKDEMITHAPEGEKSALLEKLLKE
jgi:hypothetical protein